MTLDQLVAFVSVAKTKNFTATAKALHLAQPAVTSRIKNLETDIGVTLLQRFDGTLELTAAGARLLRYAQQIVDLVKQAEVEIGQQSEEIIIGATSTLAVHFVPRILRTAYEGTHRPKFIIRQVDSLNLLNLVLEGNVDIALMTHRLEHPDIAVTQLNEWLQIVLVASENHPIVNESDVTYEVVKKYRLLRTQKKHGFWKLVDNKLREHQIEIEADVTVDNIEIAKEILLQSAFLTFMPYLSIEKELERGVLKSIPVKNFPVLQFPIYMIHHQQSNQSRNVQFILRIFGIGK
ncbi:LysR family transcriptional regulator [Alicyclobacillus dauci]|uniref:LysR family transcriptional regulator n=1 Tax=Alicyclobacillus dauci TaxID=1475485 RepID=A0ABY6YZG1_9BACL|nr:LysR family transcriptional regulator [Alicyclobacillus dauci]WAH35658.1 LysR family transcriptional regulator [Alicyclobacillus dauci]